MPVINISNGNTFNSTTRSVTTYEAKAELCSKGSNPHEKRQ